MALYLFVNGNLVHDETVVDGSHPPLTFKSAKEGNAAADALFERDKAFAAQRRRRPPLRSSYVVASEAPAPADPPAAELEPPPLEP